jgi:hypothetical protein
MPRRTTTVDECHPRLAAAGWSVGDVATSDTWLVTGTNGENVVRAVAPSQAGAWRLTCEQAAVVGMPARD